MHTTCTKDYQRQELFSLLTGKNVSWKIRHNKKIFRLKTLLVFIKKKQGHSMDLVKYKKSVEYQQSKGKNVNKQWKKISNMSINTRLV